MLKLARSLLRRALPFIKRESIFSIGIYQGSSPLSLRPASGVKNPVLRAKDVTDARALFVADPFMVREGDAWYMFVEILNRDINRGQIALATSADGKKWKYQHLVLQEPFHLSYPQVFKLDGEYYMIPETYEDQSVRLYRATNFPHTWTLDRKLLTGADFLDPSIFQHDGKWWMYVCTGKTFDTLHLYYADDLRGPWQAHPANPLITADPAIARPAGRVLVHDGRIYRFTQDCSVYYGRHVRVFEVTELTTEHYREQEALPEPLLKPGVDDWNHDGMHQIDAHQVGESQWVACVDGHRFKLIWSPDPA